MAPKSSVRPANVYVSAAASADEGASCSFHRRRRSRPLTRAIRIASSNGFGSSRRRLLRIRAARPRAAARREHEDRHELFGGAQVGGNGEAVFPRQHHVEDDDVEDASFLQHEVQRLLAIRRDERFVTLGLEIEAKAV
jgi:hypothetical protein